MKLTKSKIKRIICAYSSTNLHVEQKEELKKLGKNVEIELIGIDTISHDLVTRYPILAKEHLNIQMDTSQIFTIEKFIEISDKNRTSAPLNMNFLYREEAKKTVLDSILEHSITMVTGPSGVGKTRLVLEVCKELEQQGWEILCIKNNGQLLYNDIKYYLEENNKYVLFFDDANQTINFEFILQYLVTLSNNIDFKIVMTVRDYAKERVKLASSKIYDSNEIILSRMLDEEIKCILKTNLSIVNEDYLNQVIKISKGNPRLAILAGKIAIEKGFVALRNSTDIFVQYYGEVIESANISKDQIYVLFIIALLGTIRYRTNIDVQKLFECFKIDLETLTYICHDLNDKEIIDLYLDEVVKFSDQSLENYFIYYILVDKKMVSISRLLEIAFPTFKNRIIISLNMLYDLFYSDELFDYLRKEIKSAWEMAPNEFEEIYLECFHQFDLDKTLLIIKNNIQQQEKTQMDLLMYDIESKKNNHNIKMKDIEILGHLKYTERFEEAIELLIMYYYVRPDLFMDFYRVFTDKFGLDINSINYKFEKEYRMLELLWEYCKNGDDVNCTILFLHVCKDLLKCCIHKTEQGNSSREYKFVTIYFKLYDGIQKIRSFIWTKLSKLYIYDQYKKIINKILVSYSVSGLEQADASKIIQFDLKIIKELFYDNYNKLSFDQCWVLLKLEKHYYKSFQSSDDFFKRYNENSEFVIYKVLTKEYNKGISWQQEREIRKRRINDLICNYNLSDYNQLFVLCGFWNKSLDDTNDLRSGLDLLFETKESFDDLYLKIVELYLQNNTPLNCNSNLIISNLLKKNPFKKIKKMIESIDFFNKNIWLKNMWEKVDESIIDHDITIEFKSFIDMQSNLENKHFPDAIYLRKFVKFDKGIVRYVSSKVLESAYEKKCLAEYYLGNIYTDIEIENLIMLFNENIDILEKLYLQASYANYDYKGKLLIEIIKLDINFWDDFMTYILNVSRQRDYDDSIFNSIWKLENYKELIEKAFSKMIENNPYYMIGFKEASSLFGDDGDTLLNKRKLEWIKSYIYKNNQNSKCMMCIFNVIAYLFEQYKKELLLYYLNLNNDFECFKEIPLFSSFDSWSGSEIPRIDKKITFLKDFNNELKGINFIDHKVYVNNYIERLEKYKQEVLIKEYIENQDVA